MNFRDDKEIIETFIAETNDHLDELELGVLNIENAGQVPEQDRVNELFRAAHSIKAGANLLEFNNIEKISHNLENILHQLRLKATALDADTVSTMLQAIDTVRELIKDPLQSDLTSVSHLLEELNRV